MRITLSLVTVGTAFAAWAAPAHAQLSCNAAPGAPCSLNHGIRATAATVAQLSQETQMTSFPALTAANFDNPAGVDAPANGLTVAANVNWTITVATATNTWTGGSNSKQSTDLRILIGGTQTGLTTTAQQLATGSAGTPPSIPAQFNSLWHFATDTPGLYEITAVFTLSTP